MTFDWTISDLTRDWTGADWTVWTIAALAAVTLVAWTVRTIYRLDLEGKFELFVGATQTVMAWTVIHGTFEFFHKVAHLRTHESWLTSAAIESVMWAGAFMIFLHGKKAGTTGWGTGGPLFLIAGCGGATLAVLASENWRSSIGRIVIVVLGMATLTARLHRATRRATADADAAPSRWSLRYWRQRSTRFNPREWDIRRLARAIRWANSGRPLAWIGRWLLTRRAEHVLPDVIAEARRRAAVVHALRKNATWTSPVMVQMIERADAWTGSVDGVWTIGPEESDRSGAELDHSPARALDRSARTRPDRSADHRPDHGPVQAITGTVVDSDHGLGGPDGGEDGDELSALMRAKVAAIVTYLGDTWPDETFSGDKIFSFNLPGIRSKKTCNALAPVLNQLAETARAKRMAPLTTDH